MVVIAESNLIRFFTIILVLAITVAIDKILHNLIKKNLTKASKHIKIDHTQFTILRHFVRALIYVIGIGIAIYLIPPLKTLSISLFASAGVLAVIVGFASQKAFSNIISGIFIALFKPFRVDDLIKFDDKVGVIEDITLRHTVIRNFENKRYIIPNSVISDQVVENFSIGTEKTCKFVEMSISYDANIDKAMKIMQEEALKHPECMDNRTPEEVKKKIPQIMVKVIGFGDSSVNLRAWVWAKNPKSAYRVGWDLNKNIKKRFDKEGIEIPFPYRTIVYKKDIKKK